MDLALATGRTVAELSNGMTERELGDWCRYADQRGMPWARLEKMLARILMILDLVHMRAPGTRAHWTDYLPGRSEAEVQQVRLARAIEGDGSEALDG